MKKRILASLLSLVMVLSMFPTALAAEGFTQADEPQQDEAVCICDALCTEEIVNADCPICGEEAGYAACAGTAAEPQQDETACICDALCTEETVNADCPICGGEAGYIACTHTADDPQEDDHSTPWTELTPAELLNIPARAPADNSNVYTVGSTDELTAVLAEIKASGAAKAEICLTTNIALEGALGVEGVHLFVRSEDGKNFSITKKQEENGIYLAGDVTFQNVSPSGSLFACGHTVEFGEEYNGYGLRLYGGADYDLDLTDGSDPDSSTHIIIRSGRFHSIVGGNKDIFTQGKYHEYADWSDPNENKHTTLTGDVKIDIYGGSFGGSYNIDVGDTCCNTSVTPARLYGGGLGSDTIGNITINVYGLDYANGYNDIIVGGGFGMAGDKNDQTLYNDAIKHTGIVDGNVDLNLLGGDIAEFYGGGWHGGSAFKKNDNVTWERANQRQYHREEVAVVTGDVNIVMGGNMVLCQNTASAWGGSYASTIEGDINITIRDQAKLAAKYSLFNGGAPTPANMGELDGKYAEYYDGMYSGVGWRNRFYACGQYDIIGGSVTVNIEDGVIWELWGTAEEDWGSELPVFNTEIRNQENADAGLMINVSGGMIRNIWGDYAGNANIMDGIEVNLTDGELFSLNAYDGRNSSLSEGSTVVVNVAGGTVYNMIGQADKLCEGIVSEINFNPSEAETPVYVGYLGGFHDINVNQNANVIIDAEPVMDIYVIDYEKYGASADIPFYENVYDLNVAENAKLTTCKNATNLLGNVLNHSGTWIANGVTTINGSSQSNGTIFFKQPSTIKGNAQWNEGALLLLPVVQAGKNYDGITNLDIALTVGGASSGTAKVRTVDANDYSKVVNPAVGDNYIRSMKDGELPVQKVYLLENSGALSQGLYLKRVDDPKQDNSNYMWQVAQGAVPTYTVTYTDGVDNEVVFEDQVTSNLHAGVTTPTFQGTPIRKGYTFNGWLPEVTPIVTEDATYVAQWNKDTPEQLYSVSYDLNGGTGKDGVSYEPVTVQTGTIITVKDAPTKRGYTFEGWKLEDKTYEPGDSLAVTGDLLFVAQWHKKSSGGGSSSEDRYYILSYESNGGTEYKDERYKKNTVVELDKLPTREGYTFTGWYADEELTDRITSIKMTSDKTVYAGWEPTGVPDWLNGKDHFAYVVGYMDGTVRPLNNISRAEVATIFFRLLNEDIREENLTTANTFDDVNEGMWCNTAISTMAKLGVVKGRTTAHFDPNAPITRAEFAAICARFDTSKRTGDSDFTDISGHWAEAEIERAASLGWIMGYTDGTFRPENYITRAEAMTMINRVLNRLPEDEDDLLDGMNVWPDNKPGDWYYLAVQEATNSHDFTRKGDVHEHWTKLTADPDWSRYQ